MKRRVGWRVMRRIQKYISALWISGLVVIFLCGPVTYATPPTIYLIEKWSVNGTNGVLVHFDTDAHRTYTLQSTDRLGTNAVWIPIYTTPTNLAVASHYVIPDLRPGNHFYRLSVSP